MHADVHTQKGSPIGDPEVHIEAKQSHSPFPATQAKARLLAVKEAGKEEEIEKQLTEYDANNKLSGRHNPPVSNPYDSWHSKDLESRQQEAYEVRLSRWRDAPRELGLPRDVRFWTREQVASWVSYLGYPLYADNLLVNNISGEVLLLADNALLKECNVTAAGDRVLILRERDKLQRMPLQHSRYAVLSKATRKFPSSAAYVDGHMRYENEPDRLMNLPHYRPNAS